MNNMNIFSCFKFNRDNPAVFPEKRSEQSYRIGEWVASNENSQKENYQFIQRSIAMENMQDNVGFNISNSDDNFAGSIESNAIDNSQDEFLRNFNEDAEFIENIAREIMKAKIAIDDEVYKEIKHRQFFTTQGLPRIFSKNLLSIMPFSDTN